MSINHKLNRYKTLLREFKNWPQFLLFKLSGGKSFNFKMRIGLEIDVPKKMLPPFKKSFFDGVYFKGFPSKGLLSEAPVVIDIGANVGFFGLYILSKYPKAKVLGFEPMPFNYEQLQKYQKSYPEFDWINYNKAVADHADGLTLYSSTLDGFSTMAGLFASDGRGKPIQVETLTLEKVMNDAKIEAIDLLKLDCEGSEYSILYSLTDDILSKIKFMSIETHKGNTSEETHDAMLKYLKEKDWNYSEERHGDGYGYIWAWHQ